MVKRLQILAALALLTASPAQGELPTYTCVKTAAAAMVDVSDLSGRRQHAHPTQVRMLWDEEQLYVLFIATDPDAWSTLADRDDRLWNEEVVEFYADPDGDGANCVEIEVNPLNTVVDLLLSKPWGQNGRGYFDWSPQFATAVHVEGTINDPSDRDQYWSVEMALPWSIFASDMLDVAGGRQLPPRPGDEWRCNFYRYEPLRTGVVETAVEYSAWSPVGEIDFHRPDRFGTVVFAEASTQVMQLTWGTVKTWPR